VVAYRDNFNDPSARQFATHLGIARDAVAEIENLSRFKPEANQNVDTANELAAVWARRWSEAWDQLREARAIVEQRGRDTSGFDAALAAAGDLYVDVAQFTIVTVGNTTHATWKTRSTKPVHAAIEALCRVMPEVVLEESAPLDVDLASGTKKAIRIAYKLVVYGGPLILLAYLGYLIVTSGNR
jgi:hypothetical protein